MAAAAAKLLDDTVMRDGAPNHARPIVDCLIVVCLIVVWPIMVRPIMVYPIMVRSATGRKSYVGDWGKST